MKEEIRPEVTSCVVCKTSLFRNHQYGSQSVHGQAKQLMRRVSTGQTGSASCWRLSRVTVLRTEQYRDT